MFDRVIQKNVYNKLNITVRASLLGFGLDGIWVLLLFLLSATESSGNVLLPSTNGLTYASRDKLQISLTDMLTRGEIGVALDGNDVTAIAHIDQTSVTIIPPEHLKPGLHRIALYKVIDGRLQHEQSWSFTVRTNLQVDAGIAGTLNTAALIHDGGDSSTGNISLDGGISLDGSLSRENIRSDFYADLLIQSNDNLQFSGAEKLRSVDVGEYLLTVSRGRLSSRLGHHSQNVESLVMRGFNRRGASVSWQAKDNKYSASGFVYRTEPITGFQSGLGISDSENRVIGATFNTRVFGSEKTEASFTWIRGKTLGLGGAGVVSLDNIQSDGDAMGLALASKLLNDKLLLRAEFAQSRFDSDGDGSDIDKVKDDAWKITSILNPLGFDKTIGQAPVSLQIGMEYLHVGTDYKSLANPGLPSDLDSIRGFGNLNWKGFNLNATLERQENNANDSPLLPTIRTDLASIGLFYNTQRPFQEKRFYGRPYYQVSYQRSEQFALDSPSNLPLELDLKSDQFYFNLGSSYGDWSWTAGYSYGKQTDFTNQQADSSNQVADLGINLNLGQRLSLNANAQLGRTKDLDTGLESKDKLMSLYSNFILIPGKLTSSFDLTINQQEDDGANTDVTVSTYNLGLTWIGRPATPRRPGWSLWLKGQHQEIKDNVNSALSTDNTQVFAGASINYAR